MARPRRDSGEKPAIERMEDAFWEMLSEMPYHEMTGKELRKRSGVSHNTFYYYFDNIDDLAAKMFDRLVTSEQSRPMLVYLCGGSAADDWADDPTALDNYSKVRSLAGSASPLLIGMLKRTVVDAWFGNSRAVEACLSLEDRVDLEFAFGGLVAILSSDLADDNAEALRSFAKRDIGLGVATTFTRIYQSISLD